MWFKKSKIVSYAVLFIWLCAAVDVMTFMPKRAFYAGQRFKLSADQKLFELGGGLFTASEELKRQRLLGVTVGVPSEEETKRLGFDTPYGQHNYAALVYPGRMVAIQKPEDLKILHLNFLILDKNWPEFSFPADPRSSKNLFVATPTLVPVPHD